MRRAASKEWRAGSLKTPICDGDAVRTARSARATLWISPENYVRLDENSLVGLSVTPTETLVEFFQSETTRVATDPNCGAGYFLSRFPRNFRVKTPYLKLSVEGTEFLVANACSATTVSVVEGKVRATPQDGASDELLQPGESASAGTGIRGVIRLQVPPTDQVQWTAYVPRTSSRGIGVEFTDAPCPPSDTVRCEIDKIEAALASGQIAVATPAIDRLEAVPDGKSDALAYRSLLALQGIGTPNGTNASNAVLASSIATAAIDASPSNPRARHSASLAAQAQLDLTSALAHAREAARLAPDDPFYRARVAEVLLALDRVPEAYEEANRAVRSGDAEPRAHQILGFAQLARLEAREARQSFERAADLDSEDPQTQVGFGLTDIRLGRLSEGRERLEVAAVLDPRNSLVRSYLGRAYWAEGGRARRSQAFSQYDLARMLDPRDPTPNLYSALSLANAGRASEAVGYAQESFAQNDNRAVYRSRLLLDQDRAARAAALGRLYSDLGVPGLSRSYASQSLSDDPGNVDALRLLADSYIGDPQGEISRVSALLQAQLRQSPAADSVQPLVASEQRGWYSGLSNMLPSWNDYLPMFTREGVSLNLHGAMGNRGTTIGQATIGGLFGRTAFQVTHSSLETDGFRENNDDRRNVTGFQISHALSWATTIQAEVASFRQTAGELDLRQDNRILADRVLWNFGLTRATIPFPLTFEEFPVLRATSSRDSARIGLRHRINESTDILLSSIGQRRTDSVSQRTLDPTLLSGTTVDTDSLRTEGQIQKLWPSTSLLFGITDFRSESRLTDQPIAAPLVETDSRPYHRNAYLYVSPAIHSTLVPTLGASLEEFSSPDRGHIVRALPKLGLQWGPAETIRLRAAYFKTLKRRINADQALEPVQIAGFTQYYDDPNGSIAEVYGLGADFFPDPRVIATLEFTERRLEATRVDPATSLAGLLSQRQGIWRAYGAWIPSPSTAIFTTYRRESLEHPGAALLARESFDSVATHRLQVGVRWTHPSGLFLAPSLEYIRQRATGIWDIDEFYRSEATLTHLSLGYNIASRNARIQFDAQNLFDRDISYQNTFIETQGRLPNIAVRRVLLLRVIFSL